MLNRKLDSQLKNFFDARDEFWGCKDLDSRFIYANQSYSQVMGLNNPLDCIGLTDFDFASSTVAQAPEFLS